MNIFEIAVNGQRFTMLAKNSFEAWAEIFELFGVPPSACINKGKHHAGIYG